MICEKHELNCKGSMDYARLEVLIQDPSDEIAVKKRPMIIICPGGGYEYTSAREAEPIAFRFMAEGYNCAILYYSCAPARYPVSLLELAESVRYIRKNAAGWHVDKNGIIVMGFSAGAHLAASFGCFWKDPEVIKGTCLKEDPEVLRPNGQILCYPVITSGKYAHVGSFDNLCGSNKAISKKLSLENAVNKDTPPAFIWHTFTDESVPVENSLMFVSALREKNIPYIEEETPIVLGWYPDASAALLWNIEKVEKTVHLRRGDFAAAVTLRPLDSALVENPLLG